jgi:biotin carboxyl carrier protein
MIFAVEDDRGLRTVEVRREGGDYRIVDGDSSLVVDAVRAGSSPAGVQRWSLLIGHRSIQVDVTRDGTAWVVAIGGATRKYAFTDPTRAALARKGAGAHGPGRVTAPMPGRIVRILVEPGQSVARGDGVIVVEAMKMENELTAARDGVVTSIVVAEGQTVEAGAVLLEIG